MGSPKPLRCLVLVFPAVLSACSTTTPPKPPPGCSFEDNFDGTTLDTGRWSYRTGAGKNHRSCQVPENVSVSGGVLHIAKRKQTAVCKGGQVRDYTGGGVISNQSWTYGYFEARLKLGTAMSWHPAFWTSCFGSPECRSLPSGGLREIDMLEYDDAYNDGIREPGLYGAGIHLNPDPDWPWEPVRVEGDIGTTWHVYGADHVPGRVTFYFDGAEVKTVEYSGHPGVHNLFLSVLSLKSKPVMRDDDLPDELQVDWVRVCEGPDQD